MDIRKGQCYDGGGRRRAMSDKAAGEMLKNGGKERLAMINTTTMQ
jgi:hypothetical protein